MRKHFVIAGIAGLALAAAAPCLAAENPHASCPITRTCTHVPHPDPAHKKHPCPPGTVTNPRTGNCKVISTGGG